jgi:hypothetical protein
MEDGRIVIFGGFFLVVKERRISSFKTKATASK